MKSVLAIALVLVAACCAAGCSNKLGGELDVDGTAFKPSSCRSGRVHGFTGVRVVASDGRALHVVASETGEGRAVVFAKGATTGTDLGPCGPFHIEDQHSEINDVKNVEGNAQLSCEANGHEVSGKLTFENCH